MAEGQSRAPLQGVDHCKKKNTTTTQEAVQLLHTGRHANMDILFNLISLG